MLSKIVKIILGILAVLVIAAGVIYQVRYKPMLRLFDPEVKTENFRTMDNIFPSNTIGASESPSTIPVASTDAVFHLEDAGFDQSFDSILEGFNTTGFLVIRNDSILYENYYGGGDETSRFTSFSISKSIVSLLIGIAIDEGKIGSVEEPVDKYVPTLVGTGYEGVTIRNVLQMATGIKFSEDYDDPDSDINQVMFKAFVDFEPLEEWITEFENEVPQGTKFHYQSINTEILAVILKNLYAKSVSELLEQKIWQPMGAEADAKWITDEHETEIAFGFLNATLRDYARIGLLVLHDGEWNGNRIVSEEWMARSTVINPNEARPAKGEGNDYQFHWWIPKGNEQEVMASGYMGQVIYINPTRHVVIVKTGTEEAKHLPMIQAIAREISPLPVVPDSMMAVRQAAELP